MPNVSHVIDRELKGSCASNLSSQVGPPAHVPLYAWTPNVFFFSAVLYIIVRYVCVWGVFLAGFLRPGLFAWLPQRDVVTHNPFSFVLSSGWLASYVGQSEVPASTTTVFLVFAENLLPSESVCVISMRYSLFDTHSMHPEQRKKQCLVSADFVVGI